LPGGRAADAVPRPVGELLTDRRAAGDLAGDIFVDAVQADEGVEDEQTWPQVLDGLGKAL